MVGKNTFQKFLAKGSTTEALHCHINESNNVAKLYSSIDIKFKNL